MYLFARLIHPKILILIISQEHAYLIYKFLANSSNEILCIYIVVLEETLTKHATSVFFCDHRNANIGLYNSRVPIGLIGKVS